MVNPAVVSVLLAAVAGLTASIGIERLMVPKPSFLRPMSCWALHTGLWSLAYGSLVLIFGRPWFAAFGVSAFMLLLVLVSNAKVKSLREPFVFQDYEYFTDAIRHPRLYIPFLGWGKALAATLGFLLAVVVSLWLEAVPAERFSVPGQLGGVAVVFATGVLLLAAGSRQCLPVSFQPDGDLVTLGFLTSLWRYAEEGRRRPVVTSPFDFLVPRADTANLPHLVAVQSESFFDPRSLYPGIRPAVLAEFDRLKASSIVHGGLSVPAWGANTVRTEFAFLSGLGNSMLGAHRFNPYQAVSAGWDIPSLAGFVKRLGYRTVCVHPYPASFYQRNRVYPKLGFDEFFDIRAFDDSMRFGPYIGDLAVADKVAAILREATIPVLIFVITMENHGPLHLERVTSADVDALYSVPPPKGCDDLTVYLRHLRNADRMIVQLRQTLENCERPASLCWYGDHVPIMPTVYGRFGEPSGDVEYVIWSNQKSNNPQERELHANCLALDWLRELELSESRFLGGDVDLPACKVN